MSKSLPPEIKSGLVSLRRRIRRIQLFRGLLRTFGVVFGGLLLIVALDYFLAPLTSLARGGLFFLWLASIAVAAVFSILFPLIRKLSLVRLARWLEARHPETQERISTALELADYPEGISSQLLAELSSEAAMDISMVDPREEIQMKHLRMSLVPVGAALVVLILMMAVWPRQMGRLLTRAVSPFSELGNAGAFRFDIQPGDVERLEGDALTIDLTYTGSLGQPLEFVIEKEGETLIETLHPTKSEGETHRYSYQIHSLEVGFKYSARVAGSESDRFEAKVYPLPRLLEPIVTLQYPPYTAWPDREISLGTGVEALAATVVTLKGRLNTPLESADLIVDSKPFGAVTLERSASGTSMTWSEVLKPGLDETATLTVKHILGRKLDGAQFSLQALLDPAPVVKILTPVQRDLRVKPDEQVIINYEVSEGIGLAKAEIELEVNGRRVEPLLERLPERIDGENGRLWKGEAMIYLGSLVSQHKGAQQIRMRLALSDHRPAYLQGPGVGHSEWLAFKLENNAESLVRQELRKQDRYIRETVQKVVRDIQEARSKMHQAKGEFYKEEITERTEKALTAARERLKKAQKSLTELTERMKPGIQAHRRDEVEAVVKKLEEAKKSVENTSLQDTPESRHSELDHALRESLEALEALQEFQQEVQKDQPKTDDLARLQEMAQRQEKLARQATGKEANQDWQNKQRQLQEEIRRKVQQSPKAKAAALKSQSEQALDLAKEAGALRKSQEELVNLSKQTEPATPKMSKNQLKNALAQELNDLMRAAREEVTKARRDKDDARGKDLQKAIDHAQKAAQQVSQANPAAAAKSAQKAAAEFAKGSAEKNAQAALLEKQEKVIDALEALAEGRLADAQTALQDAQAMPDPHELAEARREDPTKGVKSAPSALAEMRAEQVSDPLAQALAREQEVVVEGTKAELSEARAGSEARANDLPEALAQAEAALDSAQKGDAQAAAEAAQQAARELSQRAEESPSQIALQQKQQDIAQALLDLAEGRPAEALAALEEMQAGRAAQLVRDIQSIPEVSGEMLQQAQRQARQGAQKASQASQSQQAGKASQASKQHKQAAQKFTEVTQSLKQASQQMAQLAAQAAEQPENSQKAPTPGEAMAEALAQSSKASEAGKAGGFQKAASSAKAAAEALRQAANQAKANMKQGGKPGDKMAQAAEAGEPGQGDQPSDEAKEGRREAQVDQGVPPELAKLGISASDWEKIQATLKTDVSGSRPSVIPEDYRGLVKKYFDQVTQKR